ncbi:GATA zinc finger domain-containing protein 8-like [Chironomus tepperi]|uniref:GATA zinc finger domain-containing protein 8-like n=1 Tax=Chironomus tepperi TaxID=113505 RepID=UPI00391FA483
MTDIISMLAQAQNKAQNENNSRQQNDSVASFFNSISKQPSTNNSTLPIQIKQNTLESIERNVIPNQDTQNNNASHNDLQTENSPLAMFLNSNNFNTVRTGQETNSSALGSASKVQNTATPQAYNKIIQSQQPLPIKNNKNISSNGTASGAKETTKLITPNMLVQSNNNNTNNNNINIKGDKKQPEPLTQNQMIQALKYLIENDDDFTKKVHDAYLKSLKN